MDCHYLEWDGSIAGGMENVEGMGSESLCLNLLTLRQYKHLTCTHIVSIHMFKSKKRESGGFSCVDDYNRCLQKCNTSMDVNSYTNHYKDFF